MKQPTPQEKAFWRRQLKSSGFEDIETGDENSGLLKTDKRIEEGRGEEYAASAEYYRRAGVFLHHSEWIDERERKVWELHAAGIGMNEIARTTHIGNTQVHAAITRLRAEMFRKPVRCKAGKAVRNEDALFRWLDREAQKLSDADLLEMAPTFLEIARPTRKTSSTRR